MAHTLQASGYAHKTIVESGCGAMWRCAATEGESGGSGGSGGRAELTLCALCTINTNSVRKQCARTQETVFVHIRQYTHNQSKEHTNSTHNKRCFFIQCVRTKSSTTTPSAWFKHIMCNQNSVQTMCTICPPCAIACTPATLCCLQSLNTVYLSGKCIVPGTLYAGNLTLCMHVVGSFHRAQQSDGAHLGFRKTMHIML